MNDHQSTPTTHRRGFIGTLAAGAAALGLSALTAPLNKLQAMPGAGSLSNSELDAFFNSLNGKHKMVFDATQPHEIFPFAWPKVFLMSNEKTGSVPADCSVMVVLRHSAIGYAMEDRLWAKYNFGELFQANDPKTKAPSTRNPFWKPQTGDFSAPGLGNIAIGINELQEQGVKFCVCETAMTVYSAVVADQMKKDAAEIRKDWMAGVLPGIKPVPSGVWALGRAQERGCGYIFTG